MGDVSRGPELALVAPSDYLTGVFEGNYSNEAKRLTPARVSLLTKIPAGRQCTGGFWPVVTVRVAGPNLACNGTYIRTGAPRAGYHNYTYSETQFQEHWNFNPQSSPLIRTPNPKLPMGATDYT